MSSHRTRLLAGAVAAGLLAAAPAAIAQTAAPPAAPAPGAQRPAEPARQMRMDPTRHIDGRIAFLKAELKITQAQEPAFDVFARELRQNAAELGQMVEKQRAQRDQIRAQRALGNEPPRPDALERMQQRADMSKAHAEQNQRMLAAFKPLYDQLSAEQKKSADELIGGRGERGGGHHRGPRRA